MKGFGDHKRINSNKLNLSKIEKDSFLKNKLNQAKNFLLSGDILQAKKIYYQLINKGTISYDLYFSYALFVNVFLLTENPFEKDGFEITFVI